MLQTFCLWLIAGVVLCSQGQVQQKDHNSLQDKQDEHKHVSHKKVEKTFLRPPVVPPFTDDIKGEVSDRFPDIAPVFPGTPISQLPKPQNPADVMQGDAPASADVSHDQRTNRRRNKKQKNKENKRLTIKTCDTNEDCDGGCCVQKKGRNVCKKAKSRDMGVRCSSSCLCKDDLRCFVSQVNRRGRKRSAKKTRTGHCVSSSLADLGKGFYIEDRDTVTL